MSEHQVLSPLGESEWLIPRTGSMHVPGRLIADQKTIEQLLQDERGHSQWSALEQIRNVASLPGAVEAVIGLPDIHPGYGFPIGGVGAFDFDEGVVVVGGVGFDINCGVRLMATPLTEGEIESQIEPLGEALFRSVPAGLGAEGRLRMSLSQLDDLLREGAAYIVHRERGLDQDLPFIEEEGRLRGAEPNVVSDRAKQRQFRQIGTLGSGNHYLEIQVVDRVFDDHVASVYGLAERQVVLSIHTGSRALGHQIGQDYLREMANVSGQFGFDIPERELVCAPIGSDEGQRYLAAVACGANCAFANRQAIAGLVRNVLHRVMGISPESVRTVYDIGHNNVKVESHELEGTTRRLLVHRKGSTRAFGPDRNEAPIPYRPVGHPIIAGGTMGTASYVLRGTAIGMKKTFGSGIHGAGRALSRKKAAKRFWGDTVSSQMAADGIRLWAHSLRGIAEEAPGAYKDVEDVVSASSAAGITERVARLRPLAVIKG